MLSDVYNDKPNSKMSAKGLYYTKDEVKTWSKSEMYGFSGEPLTIATHPSNDKIVAIGTKAGLYLSYDNGGHFEKLLPELSIYSLAFGPNGDLFVTGSKSESILQINVSTKDKKEIKIPTLESGDAVLYFAQSPKDPKEIVNLNFQKRCLL